MNLTDKIKAAERTLKTAAEMSLYYYHKPLIICYSGGKDSDVLLDIAKKCLKPEDFEVLNSHTTVDAPETVYHIRETMNKCEKLGIKTEIRLPRINGELTSMFDLIVKNLNPPTRISRYCCRILKEVSAPNRMLAFGVRETESNNRKGRGDFGTWGKTKQDSEFRTTAHTFAMFRLDQYGGEDAYQCEMIKACKANEKTVVNPIYHFTEKDIWDYIRQEDLEINPLYAEGYKRVGCIGCPMASYPARKEAFARYPKYKQNYIKAFDRMLQARKKKKLPSGKYHFENGEEVFRWWLGENPKQVTFDDLLDE